MLVCREEEITELKAMLTSKEPEFLALFGRRRVGKTFLIHSYFSEQDVVYFKATGTKDAPLKEQIKHFTEQIGQAFLGGIKPQAGGSWDESFKLLTDAISGVPKQQKIVIFLDELPWMATRKSRLLQTLDYYWNQHWSHDPRIKLIICGSSASWIIDNIINNKGGLHNRVNRTLHLEPFNLNHTQRFLKSRGVTLSQAQITQIYLLTGGVPFYLTKVKPGLSAVQVTEMLAFHKKGLLFNEFENLYASLFDSHEICIEIVKTIAKCKHGMSQEDLFKQVKGLSKGTSGLKKLKNLEDAGFILNFVPHFHKKKGIYYRVIDEYTLFYLQWIAPLKLTKMSRALEKNYWEHVRQSSAWHAWVGNAFESICYKHIIQIRRALDLPPTAIPNAWRYTPSRGSTEKGAQIDLLFDRDDGIITVGEIKCTEQPFMIDKAYAANLRNKLTIFKQVTRTRKDLFLVMISFSGVKKNRYRDELLTGVVTIDDLFKS